MNYSLKSVKEKTKGDLLGVNKVTKSVLGILP